MPIMKYFFTIICASALTTFLAMGRAVEAQAVEPIPATLKTSWEITPAFSPIKQEVVMTEWFADGVYRQESSEPLIPISDIKTKQSWGLNTLTRQGFHIPRGTYAYPPLREAAMGLGFLGYTSDDKITPSVTLVEKDGPTIGNWSTSVYRLNFALVNQNVTLHVTEELGWDMEDFSDHLGYRLGYAQDKSTFLDEFAEEIPGYPVRVDIPVRGPNDGGTPGMVITILEKSSAAPSREALLTIPDDYTIAEHPKFALERAKAAQAEED